jgi:hypothetical protein
MDQSVIRVPKEVYGETYRQHVLEIYKVYVASADKVSERRATANNYLLTVNSFLVTLYGLAAGLDPTALWRATVPIAGILVCATWWALIRNYRNLNTAKFAVIHELEAHLPVGVYAREWQHADAGRSAVYRPLTHIEQWIPLIFGVLYLVLGAYAPFAAQARARADHVDVPAIVIEATERLVTFERAEVHDNS